MGPQRLIALLLLPVLVGGCRDEGSPTVDGTITGSTLESGVVDPPIGRTYALEAVQDALSEMADRRTLGKSVLVL